MEMQKLRLMLLSVVRPVDTCLSASSYSRWQSCSPRYSSASYAVWQCGRSARHALQFHPYSAAAFLHQPHLESVPSTAHHALSAEVSAHLGKHSKAAPPSSSSASSSSPHHGHHHHHLHHHHHQQSQQQQHAQQVVAGAPDGSQTHVSCLYREILALVFGYLDVRDKGRAALVCTSWRDAAYHKSVWRGVVAKLLLRPANTSLFASLVRRVIRRVQVLSLRRSLRDVVQGVPNIESLNLSSCYNVTDIGLSHAFVAEVPSLTHLDLSLCKQVTDTSLGRIAQCLKNLESLELGGCCIVTNTGLLLTARGLRHLRRLNLRSCWHISDQDISYLAGLNRYIAEGNLALEYLGLQEVLECKLCRVAVR
ncbi:F-box/LRR-repeat protein 14-like [Schistocerca nitens]|uniref:F-box/LRR-repeat protein 14-like n=1 Tax=Schistocerca nitens TaxID=7011 RepID=UPI0021199984|nr:F-box/LRR-repeat protein 14-like [Schistocerca nitens]